MFPTVNTEEHYVLWREFLKAEKELRNTVITELKRNMDDSFEIFEKKGKPGTLNDIPQLYVENKLNQFFRFIQVKRNNRYYTLLFKRFYIDKNCCVNCKYGEIQYFSSLSGRINEKAKKENWIIHYPKSYIGQNEKIVKHKKSVNVYNPKGFNNIICLDNKEYEKFASLIVASFSQYIVHIDQLESFLNFVQNNSYR